MDADFLRSIWPVFSAEAREHLEVIASGILELEREPRARTAGLQESVKRTAHSLKGSAATLGLEDIERVAHALEDFLMGVDESQPLAGSGVELALKAVESIESCLGAVEEGASSRIAELAELLRSLGAPIEASLEEAPEDADAHGDPDVEAALELWPVFKTEAYEQLEALERGLRESAPPGSLTDAARALSACAQTLQAADLEQSIGALEPLLADGGKRGELDTAVSALRASLQRLDASVVSGEKERPAPVPVRGASRELKLRFAAEATQQLAAVERGLGSIFAPDPEGGDALLREAYLQAHNLGGSAGAVGAERLAVAGRELEQRLGALLTEEGRTSKQVAATADLVIQAHALLERHTAEAEAEAVEPDHEPELAPVTEVSPAAAPAPSATSDSAAGAAPQREERTIRVSTGSLDELSRQLEELWVVWLREDRRLRGLGGILQALQAATSQLSQHRQARKQGRSTSDDPLLDGVTALRRVQSELNLIVREASRDLQQVKLSTTLAREGLREARMVPASVALEPLRRSVRDVAGRLKKQVEVKLEGEDVRLDRRILDVLREPLLHLVRNAVDHGIEMPEERITSGKPAVGRLSVRVERRGHRIVLTVADDGKGLSPQRVKATAVRRGLLTEEAAARLGDREAARLIFRPGFSTADQVTAISGRGVGLDVVHDAVASLQGTVEVEYVEGKGTQFILDLPLTLAAVLSVLARVGADTFAIPCDAVERVLRVAPHEISMVGGHPSVRVGGTPVSITSLAQVLGLPAPRRASDGASRPAVLISAGGERVALTVDLLLGQQELVVRSLGRFLGTVRRFAGAAVLDDGRVVGVLNATEALREALASKEPARSLETRPTVVVADDALTTRTAIKGLLELAGYRVLPAVDGEEAFAILQRERVHLLVSDVQMPKVDGLELCRRVRAEPSLSRLPVILVTALDAADERAAGMEAGADAYIVKREVERGKLIELVRQLAPEVGG